MAHFNVAARLRSAGGAIKLMHVSDEDAGNVLPLVHKMMGGVKPEDYDVLDVHQPLDDGRMVIVYEGPDWPRGAVTEKMKGILLWDAKKSGVIQVVGNKTYSRNPDSKKVTVKETSSAMPGMFNHKPLKWYKVVKLETK